ncbi:hypothetical protein BS47DRAFT_1400351 [Hydnum rufescens UP504]|uniref:Uncharacterized protein n=1 Tax=Hydnum rufescens UP504 TaxID=1448309 RepID=A0A9P6AGI5_9AGAM|nr:hypothetical protein BS47DRAFT_1400351 [Hydnum rufescens UP504]
MHVLNHYTFFLELLRHSPWTRPNTIGQYDRRPHCYPDPLVDPPVKGVYEGREFDGVLCIAELGGDVPDSSYDDMAKYESNMKEKATAAQSSGLPSMGDVPAHGTQAGAPTSKSRPSTIERTRSNTPRDPPNPKYGLLRSLLTMGALRPALFILSKFPWLSNSHPEIADLFLHMIRTSLAPICEPISPSGAKICTKSRPNLNRIIIETGCAPKFVPKKKLIVVHTPTLPSNMYTDYTYFYPAWLDTVPLCTTRREIFSVIQPMLRYVHVKAYRDISVLTQLYRNDTLFDVTLSEWRTMLRLYLLPALSMTRSNAAFNVEIWNLLRFYNQTERWGMYGVWALAHIVHPEVKVRHIEVTREVRGILRRVTVNTNNKLSLRLAKLAHSNPCLVFSECIKQAMAYDNLIEAIAESARSLTFLGYDVLIYAILMAFSNSSKPRMKDDGTSVALWLQSLSTYTTMWNL